MACRASPSISLPQCVILPGILLHGLSLEQQLYSPSLRWQSRKVLREMSVPSEIISMGKKKQKKIFGDNEINSDASNISLELFYLLKFFLCLVSCYIYALPKSSFISCYLERDIPLNN